jgi:hypothetical protein
MLIASDGRLSTHSSRPAFARAAIEHLDSATPLRGARMPGTIPSTRLLVRR